MVETKINPLLIEKDGFQLGLNENPAGLAIRLSFGEDTAVQMVLHPMQVPFLRDWLDQYLQK